jgi:hypothetical protein
MLNRFGLNGLKGEVRQPSFKEDLMKNNQAQNPQTTRRLRLTTCAAALAVAFTVSLPQLAHADHVTPPPVPSDIQVPAGNKAFLEGHAVGTQDYICLPSGWTFFGPQATLFNDHDKQIITHFLSPNPDESGTPRATWQHSRDTSTVWAVAIASSSDSAFVAPDAIPWLLLQVVGAQDGPTGGDKLSETTFIQRLHTSGAVVPSTGCTLSIDVGKKELVSYTADYFFYKAAKSEEKNTGDDHDDED